MDEIRSPSAEFSGARESGRAAWRAARNFEDLCLLGAAFLERRCAHFPGWGSPDPDEETDAIRDALVALHSRGFLSVASQPGFEGTLDGHVIRQRAFVAGFARPALARSFVRADRIAVRAWFPDGSFACGSMGVDGVALHEPEAMTCVDGVARVVSGHDAREAELALFADELGEAALRELAASAYVTAWDPEFGRARFLWDEMLHLGAH
ncbi:MAG: hypothetical protein NTY35_15450 [Planctomycetota bacterium]|nr:hypothetical protein [Planctomycetota bacterium]